MINYNWLNRGENIKNQITKTKIEKHETMRENREILGTNFNILHYAKRESMINKANIRLEA